MAGEKYDQDGLGMYVWGKVRAVFPDHVKLDDGREWDRQTVSLDTGGRYMQEVCAGKDGDLDVAALDGYRGELVCLKVYVYKGRVYFERFVGVQLPLPSDAAA